MLRANNMLPCGRRGRNRTSEVFVAIPPAAMRSEAVGIRMRVLAAIGSGTDGSTATPVSEARIAELTALDRETVQAAVRDLQSAGLVSVQADGVVMEVSHDG